MLGSTSPARALRAEDLCRILLEDAGVAAIPGAAFGPAGKDFIRFSFASSMATLQEAVERILKVSTAWQGNVADECGVCECALIVPA